MDVEITREPRWLQQGASYDLTPFVTPAAQHATARLVAALQDLTAGWGGIQRGWVGRTDVQGRDVVSRVVNAHPGARPHDQGARWAPGRMPPWSPRSRLSFAAAKAIALRGLPAQHWVDRALALTHDELQTIIAREGVGAWLRALAG